MQMQTVCMSHSSQQWTVMTTRHKIKKRLMQMQWHLILHMHSSIMQSLPMPVVQQGK